VRKALGYSGAKTGHDERRAALLLLGILLALLFGAGGRRIFIALRVALRFFHLGRDDGLTGRFGHKAGEQQDGDGSDGKPGEEFHGKRD